MYKITLKKLIKKQTKIICKMTEAKGFRFAGGFCFFCFFSFIKENVLYSPRTTGPREGRGSLSALFSLQK